MMKSSEYGRISDELLSAYIDNAITEQERNLVETAVASDAEVAWRLNTLLQTVHMLHALPELALPRSFTIQESLLLDDGPRTARTADRTPGAPWIGRLTQSWRDFWQAGAPVYRNLAAASLILLLVLFGGNALFSPGSSTLGSLTAPAAEPAQEMAAAEPLGAASAAATPGAPAEAAVDSPSEESVLADSARQMTPLEEGRPADAPLADAAGPRDAQASAIVQEGAGQTTSPPEVAADMAEAPAPEVAADMAEAPAPEVPPLAADSPASVPPGDTRGFAIQADEAPGSYPSVLNSTQDEDLGGAATESQPLPDNESAETGSLAAEAFAAAAPPAESANADDNNAVPLTSTGALEASDASALEEPLVAEAEMTENEADALAAAGQQTDAGVTSQEIAPPADTVTALLAQKAVAEPTASEGTSVAAALPTAQPIPQAAPQTQPSDSIETGPRLPLQPISLGLLIATLLFGGLWWRSRSTA